MESNTSTRIMKMEYYIKKKLLVVTFKSGTTYEYLEVPPKVAEGFMQTNSICLNIFYRITQFICHTLYTGCL